MCGIVGYVGDNNAREVIIDGLKRLEYRGYDSAGIALNINDHIEIRKHVGEIKNLEKIIEDEAFESNIGIGHTRWATHGAPSDINAHPHSNADNTIAVVHNGIIENFVELREMLETEHGIVFKSETDTEVIAHLIGIYDEGNLVDAVYKAVSMMRGAYAIGAVSAKDPGRIIAVRKDAPLVAGIGRGCNFIASDIPALLKYVREVYLIENGETVVLDKDSVKIYDEDRNEVKRDVFHVTWDSDAAEKEGFEHFMLKEIYEQPKGVSETLNRRLDKDGRIKLDGIKLTKEDLDNISKIYIVACGTAYHAGLIGKAVIEKFAGIPVEVDVASEFRYRDPLIDENTLFIAISQSGETLDTLAALREAKRKGARVLSVVNVVGSSVARESNDVFYTWAGPEIAVASTKAYTTQLMCMYLLALYMGQVKNNIDEEYLNTVINELKKLPQKLEEVLKQESAIASMAEKIYRNNNVFFIGRGMDSSIAYEGSLKLKEISYINSFAMAAGELKHGTIALMEPGTLVIALAAQEKLYEKMLSNIQEIKARGAFVIGIAKDNSNAIEKQADMTIYIPDCIDEVSPVLEIVPLQILAYHVARLRGCNIDKPKNLAKSVTVE